MYKVILDDDSQFSQVWLAASKWRCDSAGSYAFFNARGDVIKQFNVGEVVKVEKVNG